MNETNVMVAQKTSIAVMDNKGNIVVDPKYRKEVTNTVLSFLDAAPTANGQSTFYNSRSEQQETIEEVHKALMTVNRGLYAAMLTLPGLMDYSIQQGLLNLLSTGKETGGDSFLTPEQETVAVELLADKLPPQRLFKFFVMVREKKINNARTRKLILKSILSSPKLPFWAVKYRGKLHEALVHAWGQKLSGALRSALSKKTMEARDTSFIRSMVGRPIGITDKDSKDVRYTTACECTAFIMGVDDFKYTVEILKAFYTARKDLEKGSVLPPEVLEGIRATYHKGVPRAKVLELTKHTTMTDKQKLNIQKTAKKLDVEVEFDPARQKLLDLYVYALERGCSDDIRRAMVKKSKEIARSVPIRYDHIGVILDSSGSMLGGKEAKKRPMAVALSMKDVLVAAAGTKSTVKVTGGKLNKWGLIQPSGDTSLAESLVEVASENPDAIYMITDGYENTPAGRTAEVIRAMRKIGIKTPIYQVTPVMSAETAGVRKIADDVHPMPVANPEGIGISLVRAAIENDIGYGIAGLLNIAKPMLEAGPKDDSKEVTEEK